MTLIFINYQELFHLLQFPSHREKKKAPTCLIAFHSQIKASLQSVIEKKKNIQPFDNMKGFSGKRVHSHVACESCREENEASSMAN